jgi:hypothetical protein
MSNAIAEEVNRIVGEKKLLNFDKAKFLEDFNGWLKSTGWLHVGVLH